MVPVPGDPAAHILSSASSGALVTPGGRRLPREKEIALNLLLKRAAGEEDGMQLYRLGWAMEDNCTDPDPANPNRVRFNFDRRTPVCFHHAQASYHLLAWAPPTSAPESHLLKGEDVRKGEYNCIFHFIDPKTDEPFDPTASLIENIIPMLKEFNEIAVATRRGFGAEMDRLRRAKVNRWQDEEKKKEADYNKFADDLLADTAPAFEGQPTSFPGAKEKTFADLRPGERTLKESVPASEQPDSFAFSIRHRGQS